ncbi:hypothetical protein BX600DRAFT_369605, partial [Xylariales sp. PMI_506]
LSKSISTRDKQNPHTAELTAINQALQSLQLDTHQLVVIITCNKAAALTLKRPRQQSGQIELKSIYDEVKRLRTKGNKIRAVWKPANSEFGLMKISKTQARQSTKEDIDPPKKSFRARSTTLGLARRRV